MLSGISCFGADCDVPAIAGTIPGQGGERGAVQLASGRELGRLGEKAPERPCCAHSGCICQQCLGGAGEGGGLLGPRFSARKSPDSAICTGACRRWQKTTHMQARYGYGAYALIKRMPIGKVDGRDNPPSRVARRPTHPRAPVLSAPSTCKLNTTTTTPNRPFHSTNPQLATTGACGCNDPRPGHIILDVLHVVPPQCLLCLRTQLSA
ncbi:hypothetical protein BGX38DRAFT_123288 [Terfezia claveryi]|nr:hypothetical protein BGX38DRAFT_123288 [Terfezia claveryi]